MRSLERVENKLESVLSVASLATTPSHRHTNSRSRVLWPGRTCGFEGSCPDVLYQLVRQGTSVMLDQSESIIDFTYQGNLSTCELYDSFVSQLTRSEGSCQIFSFLNTKCVDLILGDHSFSTASKELLKQVGKPRFTMSLPPTAVPSNLRHACLESFISESTSACGMFQLGEIIAIFHEYDHKRISPSPKKGLPLRNAACTPR
ncbi:uncharacterized protein BDZ83DRAFT_652503 [Colletotrichum acutatum]|uniref:Uncharacterized protein n=1 Tax=Glomerella acutata TaxID=27357 RepID=A0AAD8UMK7_GLOAC|nr:uncharacterized protein BDZ83DRAFT_652503 [Colletotrichum acutatum]KAK1724091.1 hypothetical protein BDZ83DRAFT_652503 [Colletotrichum acutatum]